MRARLHFIVEGQTEETFVNLILIPHLARFSIWGDARCVMTGRKRGIKFRGGLSSYARARKDLVLWMKQEQNPDAFFTTMFDFYALPKNFPGYAMARQQNDPYQRVEELEKALSQDIQYPRFIPYIQLHEFEALLLSDPQKLDSVFPNHDKAIKNLVNMVSNFQSPERIDDKKETAPSKRIILEIPSYEGMKKSAGPIVTEKIGLPSLRSKCQHFNKWLTQLEILGASA